MSDAVLQAKIRAFDEFTAIFNKYKQELRQIDQAQKQAAGSSKDAGMQIGQLLRTAGEIGGLLMMKQALTDVINTGREFELIIKQANAVTGDFSTKLRDLAMASRGGAMDVHTPRELAEAYRELGAAGATVNEIMEATPDILEFGIAAMLNTEDAAYGTMAAIKAFNIPLSEARTITDAYTEAMNRGALAGRDFQWIMSSAGAVAKMAGQDFREILSVGSAMRDAGVQAQDAGTSIKSALMALMNPTKEAQETIDQLGIKIYDASGNMKQWSDIVAEFERALGPYNNQARQMILTTIFGSDGIRAMATSLNKGSDYLRTFTEGLKNADGATHRMAMAMGDTFDGAIRRTNASLERAKILMFEDFAQAATPLLNVINTIIIGFNNLDDGARRYLEVLIGAGGLVMAIGAVANAMKALGIAITFQTGILGIGLAALTAFAGAVLYLNGQQAMSYQMHLDNARAAQEQISQIEGLTEEYNRLASIQQPTNEEQERLKQVTKELTDTLPAAIIGFDETGNAMTNMKAAASAAADEISRLRTEMKAQAELAGAIAKARMPKLKERYEQLEIEANVATQALRSGHPEDLQYVLGTRYTYGEMLGIRLGLINDKELAVKKAQQILDDFSEVAKEYAEAEAAMAAADAAAKGGNIPGRTGSGGGSTRTSGTRSWTPPKRASDEAAKAARQAKEAAQNYVQAIEDALRPYEMAVAAAAAAVTGLASKEQYLNQVMQSGRATAYQEVELNRTRVMLLGEINVQQDKLHRLADQQRAKLAELGNQLKKTHNPEVIRILVQEMDRLQQEIDQAGQQWWQLEQQELATQEAMRQAIQKKYDDVYQKAIDAMRHEVAMARMSTEQQIAYLTRLKNAHQWTQEQMWQIEEELFRLRRQQLSDYLDNLEEEYQEKLEKLNDETKAKVAELQAQIDALSQDDKMAQREEAERQHNKRLEELREQLLYHQRRTGKEHEKAILEIQEEIAEEERQWQLQQDEWAREDQRANLEEQIENVQNAAEEQRNTWEEHYRQAREIAEDGMLDIIASMAATSPEWYDTGKQLIDQLIAGLESGDFSGVVSQVEDLKNQVQGTGDGGTGANTGGVGNLPNQINIAEIGPSQYIMVGNKAAMWSQDLAAILGGLPVSWNQAIGQVQIGGKWFKPLKVTNGRSYVGIREVAEALGYGVVWDEATRHVSIYRAYAMGGPVDETGPAIVHEGEYVLPRNLVEAIRKGQMPPATLSGGMPYQTRGDIERLADRIIAAIERMTRDAGDFIVQGPLFHTDATYMGDEMTPEITGRQLFKGARSAARGRGYPG